MHTVNVLINTYALACGTDVIISTYMHQCLLYFTVYFFSKAERMCAYALLIIAFIIIYSNMDKWQ